MSKFLATITAIQSSDILNIVTFKSGTVLLKMMSLDLAQNVLVGREVKLQVKATSVALAKNFSGELSYSNQIELKVASYKEGVLLTTLQLHNDSLNLESIITTASFKRMKLQVNTSVTALIKSSDLSIAEVL